MGLNIHQVILCKPIGLIIHQLIIQTVGLNIHQLIIQTVGLNIHQLPKPMEIMNSGHIFPSKRTA